MLEMRISFILLFILPVAETLNGGFHQKHRVLNHKISRKMVQLCLEKSSDSTSTSLHLPNSEQIDYLVTDSVDLPDEERPPLLLAISNPRDLLSIVLLIVGVILSICNALGIYDDSYVSVETAAIYLGAINGFASVMQQLIGYQITRSNRPGIADDGLVTFFAGIYSSAVTWLAWRASAACPAWLLEHDRVGSFLAICVFAFGIIVPALTLLGDRAEGNTLLASTSRNLSATEKLRVKGILALGILGAVFIPDCVAFGIGGEAWWARAVALHPAQQTLESSTALFALFATEASMVAHRCGKKGVAPVMNIVPVFFWVCVVLAIFPCAAALWWLGNDISFFCFYRE